MRALIPFSLALAVLQSCHGLKLPFEVRVTNPTARVQRRGTSMPISNTGNAQYIGNITLGGVLARVMLDTGRYAISLSWTKSQRRISDAFISSDLWAAFPKDQPVSKDTGTGVTLAYAVGKASGSSILVEHYLQIFSACPKNRKRAYDYGGDRWAKSR